MIYATCLVLCSSVLGDNSHCNTGKYRNMANIATSSAVQCDQCPSGYFQPQQGKDFFNPTICTECPVGYFSGIGWGKCGNQCPPGSKSVEASKSCLSCELGKYQGVAGKTACSICPGGKYSNVYDCEICPSGKFSKDQASQCTDCSTNEWSVAQSDHCEACTWCLPGACMPKAENDYCNECNWGMTQITSIYTLNRKIYDSNNYKDQLVMNSMYDKDTVMAESCKACCKSQSVSCINKGVSNEVLAASTMTVEGSKQVDAMRSGMCSFWLMERSCDVVNRKQKCTVDLEMQTLVNAAPAVGVSWTLLVALSLLAASVTSCI